LAQAVVQQPLLLEVLQLPVVLEALLKRHPRRKKRKKRVRMTLIWLV
jgi:hypothetical protein